MTFTHAIFFWLAKPVSSFLLGLALVLALWFLWFLLSLPRIIKQMLCAHRNVREDGSCNAWCIHCHKNLGFMGTWRDQHKE